LFQDGRSSITSSSVESDRLANALARLGLEKGDRVCLHLPNCPEYILCYWAVLKAGGVVVPTSILRSEDGLFHEVSESGSRMIISKEHTLERVEAVRQRTRVECLLLSSTAGYDLEPVSRLLPKDAHDLRLLLKEGDETRELSLLVSGRVALTEHVPGRGSVTLMTVEPGDVFGWSALIPPFRATSTVVSLEPVKVIAFDGARLRAEVRSDMALAAGVYQQLLEAVARRMQATRHQLLDLYRAESSEPW
jgi:hypothetical protein